jgi:hypothetical protein
VRKTTFEKLTFKLKQKLVLLQCPRCYTMRIIWASKLDGLAENGIAVATVLASTETMRVPKEFDELARLGRSKPDASSVLRRKDLTRCDHFDTLDG